MRKVVIVFILMIQTGGYLSAQVGISIDNSSPDPSSALDVRFNNKGFLPPRMSHAGLDSIQNPAEGLMVYCTNCGTGATGCLAVFRNGGWHCLQEECLLPSPPSQGSHTISATQVVWNWNTAAGATGYKWSTSGSYAGATDLGNVTTRTETGLACATVYTRYVWAYNACGRSDSVILAATTLTCAWSCGQTITDPRDSRTYGTVLIGTQCWLSQNLNIGTRIDDNNDQSNNATIEKYCYNNTVSNCDVYGGLYQWAEMVQYLNGGTNTSSWSPVPSGNIQGICMSGWHIPSYGEWSALLMFLGGNHGGKMKETGLTHWASPNTGATNSSGFTGLPGGWRQSGGGFGYLTTDGMFRGKDEFIFPDEATVLFLNSNTADAALSFSLKSAGLSVRCIKD
jgi:uncharacterized protein (TIGR02145 family)